MKVNGKEVIEIRPMTRWEYGYKNNIWDIMESCQFCKYKFFKYKDEKKSCRNRCPEQPAYVNGKFKMIVKVR